MIPIRITEIIDWEMPIVHPLKTIAAMTKPKTLPRSINVIIRITMSPVLIKTTNNIKPIDIPTARRKLVKYEE